MSSAIPLSSAGAVSSTSSQVENAHTPGPDFNITCDYLALPSNCNARILPSQINAIVSELMSLAECFDPNGTWACNSVENLCTAFTNYRTQTGPNTLTRDIQDILCGLTEANPGPNALFLFCNGSGDIHLSSAPFTCEAVVDAVCGSLECRQTLAACLITQTGPNNVLRTHNAGDDLLYVPSHGINFVRIPVEVDDNIIIDNDVEYVLANDTFTIPNGSPFNVPVGVTATLRCRLVERIHGAFGSVSMEISDDPGFPPGNSTMVMSHFISNIHDDRAGVDVAFDFKSSAVQTYTVPPGGLQMYARALGVSDPPNGLQTRIFNARVIAIGYFAGSYN